MILSECDICRRKYRFEDDFEGEVVRCKSCTAEFEVPFRTLYEKVFGQKEIRERRRGERKQRRDDKEPSLLTTVGIPVSALVVCLLLVIGGIEVFSAAPAAIETPESGEESTKPSAASAPASSPRPQPVSQESDRPQPGRPTRLTRSKIRAMTGRLVTSPNENFPGEPTTVEAGLEADGSVPSEFLVTSAQVISAIDYKVELRGRNLNRLVSVCGSSAPAASTSFRTPIRASNLVHFEIPAPDLPVFRVDIPGESVFLVSDTSPSHYGSDGEVAFQRIAAGQMVKAAARARVIVVGERATLDLPMSQGPRIVVLMPGARLSPVAFNRHPLTIFCTKETTLPRFSGPVRTVILPGIRVIGLEGLRRIPILQD